VRVKTKAKFLARHSANPKIEIGVYKDSDFDTIMNGENKKLSCSQKRDMAIERVELEVPADSKWGEVQTISF
jgi:hypothetical protein